MNIWNHEPDWDRDWGEQYDDVYDNDGEAVASSCCHEPIKFDGIGYICPKCKRRISRTEFFRDYVEPYGPECYKCHTNFPRCIICHRNHQDECDRWNLDNE